jgi:trk system potassium uptake protein TrkH
MWLGQGPVRALLHGVWIFMSSWSTGGFAPQSYNSIYYHSLLYEVVTIPIFVIGSFNFALHWAVWAGEKKEIYRNIEIISFFTTVAIAMLLAMAGLMKLNVYPDVISLFRKAFYHVASAHTTTGLGTIYSRTFVRQWGTMAMLGIILAMAIGASACSTGGGFKGIRMGIIFKGVIQDVRRLISPESARIVEKWHHISTRLLDDATVRMAMLIVLSYVGIYALGTVVGVYYGYDLVEAMFDAVSAGSNTGLSCGVVSPTMPTLMKVVYLFEMWAGRLEFMSLFALAGYLVALFRGR